MATLALSRPKAKRSPTFWRDTLRGYLFILPVVLGLLIWTFGPMIASAYYSLTNYQIISAPQFIGLKNFVDLFKDPDFATSLSVTLRYGFMYVALSQVVCIGLAVLLSQKVRGQTIFRTIFYLPIIVPFVASSLLWKYIYDSHYGPLDSVLNSIGLRSVNWLGSTQSALFSLVLMSVWSSAVTTIIYVAGLQNIPEELLNSAKIDGANAFQRFFRIVLPMLTPTVFFNVVTGIIGAFQFFTPAFVMTEGGPVKATYFYNYNLYEKAFKWLEMGYASSMAWVLFGIIIVLTLLIFRSSALWVYYEGERS